MNFDQPGPTQYICITRFTYNAHATCGPRPAPYNWSEVYTSRVGCVYPERVGYGGTIVGHDGSLVVGEP